MIIEKVQSLNENGEINSYIPELEDINLHLVYSMIQFLNRYNMIYIDFR